MALKLMAIMACVVLAGTACKDEDGGEPVTEADGSAGDEADSKDAGDHTPMVRGAGTGATDDPGTDAAMESMEPDDGIGDLDIPGDVRLDGLTKEQKETMCAWAETLPGIGVEMECPDGSTVESNIVTGAACVQSLTGIECAATVGEFEACLRAQLSEPCEFLFPECDPIFECAQ